MAPPLKFANQAAYGSEAPSKNQKPSSWSNFNKKFDEFTNFFSFNNNNSNNHTLKVITDSDTTLTKDTPSNEYSSYADIPMYSQVNHSHKQQQQHSSSNSSSTSSSPSNQTASMLIFPPAPQAPHTKTPEYYPSPPESLPDTSFTQQQTTATNRLG